MFSAMVAQSPVAVARSRREWRASIAALMLLISGCVGSPATLALQPAFDLKTPAGIASVSIRATPPGMTDREFTRLVEAGMTHAVPSAVISEPTSAPFPSRRIVWHVNYGAARGVSQLTVNIFDGARPLAYEQEEIANDAPAATIEATIGTLTERLLAAQPGQEINAPEAAPPN